MEAEIKKQIRVRGVHKGKITRIKHFMEAFSLDKYDFQMLQIKYDYLIDAWQKYDEIQIFLETHSENEDDDRIETENIVHELRSKIQKLLDTTNKENSGNDSSSNNSGSKGNSCIILPQINIPKFDGSYSDWLSFSEFFKVLVHDNSNLSPVQKFHYLTSSLAGQARHLIKNLSLTSDNYIVAWNLLENRYANKRLIASNHAQEVIDVPSLSKESASGLAEFIDKVSSNINALKALEVNYSEFILIQLVTRRLDPNTIKAWEMSIGADEFPTTDDFLSFLEKRRQMLENASTKLSTHTQKHDKQWTPKNIPNYSKHSQTHHVQTTVNKNTCPCCKQNHAIYKCQKFHKMAVDIKLSFVKQHKLCFNCLNRNHTAKECTNVHKCKHCGSNHHSLLHFEGTNDKQGPPKDENVAASGSYCGLKGENVSRVLLATAVISVQDKFGQNIMCRALLDAGSQANFISESLAQRLMLKRQAADLNISGINTTTAHARHSIKVKISSHYADFTSDLTCFVLPRITGEIPSANVDISQWCLPGEIQLADKHFNIAGTIEHLLMGAEIFLQLLLQGRVERGTNFPVLQETKLGLIVSGRLPREDHHQDEEVNSLATVLAATSIIDIQRQLQKFWEIEEVIERPCRSKEDESCEIHFRENTARDGSGRFIVKLPRRAGHKPLGHSLTNAETRFLNLERKLNRNEKLKNDYVKFMKEYLELGHMRYIDDISSLELQSKNQTYYLPHHAVFKESSTTTKTRVVFDASAKTDNNVSLNDILMIGPTIQQDIISLVLRFRTHIYVMTADITKMYRQVQLHSDDHNLQRILWRDKPQEEIGHYRLTTLTYGTAPAAFLATRCLVQLAQDNVVEYPHASCVIMRDFYIDDLQTGGDDINQIIALQRDLSKILASAGFPLHKWCANDKRLIESIPRNEREVESLVSFGNERMIKTLGLLWDYKQDVLKYDINIKYAEGHYTKRMVLSIIASIYDVLGLIGPFTAACKIFMQRLWQHNLNWDEKLPDNLTKMWADLCSQMSSLKEITIPRLVKTTKIIVSTQLQGFSDASESAYGARIYLRTVDTDGNVTVRLLCSKSRIAPLRQISLPRLELCGALILSRLIQKILPIVCLDINDIYLWTDSTVVLAWLSATPCKWKTFVANRVAEIQEITDKYYWKHVSSQDNPADILSRGTSPQKLQMSHLWWNGPSWLQLSERDWPQPTHSVHHGIKMEMRSHVMVSNITHEAVDLSTSFSSLTRMLRVMTYVLRFAHNIRHPDSKITTFIIVKELDNTLQRCIKQVQYIHFYEEIKRLKESDSVYKGSSIIALYPFLDNFDCLRVGGRIQQADLNYEQKRQLILPSKAHLTRLIIKNEHERLLHGGLQLVQYSLNQRYWIVHGKATIRSVLHGCIRCFRFKTVEAKQLMGQLPKDRVQMARPFTNVGVDYAGPFTLRQGGRRSKTTTKCYASVFICLATKAIHMELVSDLSTDAFLAALRRFVSRRGLCLNIYSNNGTNFIGANNTLKSFYKMLLESQEEITHYTANKGINWKFIPPNSPHFGGIWEAGVKSMKYHLRRIVGKLILSFEELNTILTQIEACLNSRPICQISSDPFDPQALTPGHFLIGAPIMSLPDPDMSHIPVNRLNRWQLVQQCVQHLWRRWSTDYLSQLQQRSKWQSSQCNVQPGMRVLLKEDNIPPLHWRLAVIEDIFRGPDNLVRVVSLRTSSGILKRAINRVCLLPNNDVL